jgi:nucleoside-diphosphate-sugar epimerase
VLELTESSSELVYVPYDEVYAEGIEDMLHRIPSTQKIDGELGWQPTLSLDQILEDVIAFVRTRLAPV